MRWSMWSARSDAMATVCIGPNDDMEARRT